MATAAQAARVVRAQETARRSVSIAVSPPPVTLTERRSILQLLEKHGPVEHFRAIPGKDASFISLMRDAAAATKVTTSSPYKVIVQTPTKSTTPANEKRKASAGGFGTLLNVIESRHTFKQDNQEDLERVFTVEVSPSPDYRHQLSAKSTLSRPWPDFIKDQKSFISETLNQSLPDSLATTGLKQWAPDFGAQPSRNSNAAARFALRNGIPSKFRRSGGKEEASAENDEPEDVELEDDIEQPTTEKEKSVKQDP
ncbi:Hypothetical protein NCS54_00705400 [Fusarium falciforme]|uniref:Hypothetical protein n=1 Tax=Fusarium falciforme TaxID=195108 RepID=UPI002300BC1D|nr:Hypothetical protein NCS54_00705400 [Fusarium falciforme]WAO89657.1 Hypothetical protein NCS54_00705400 [Fusarium falciforme]